MLGDYILRASDIHHGLSSKQVRILAYEFAVANNKRFAESWSEKGMAGKEWLFGFRQRYKLTLRTPEQISLSRATSFNKTNIEAFFKNLRELRTKYNLESHDIYNLDETATTTVHKPPKISTKMGNKNVGQVTSAERGTLVTLVGIIGATGEFVPPFLIFPRVHFKEHMLHGAPPGSKGIATPTGWMNSSLFLPLLQHFAEHERPTREKPKLILLDNHESHLSIVALDFAKENGILMLTLSPHCSHKIQPLDVSVFGPFKNFYNSACDKWMVNHPGRPITIHDVAGLVGEAFPQAFTPKNICRVLKPLV
ncbi:uncharacterized protein [Leptinotarsa decemlineata]|uniref:uncharacterized protein n=1 Tax=Leptinotarsa decemlineata TaxID=7539 RepID=UPI003D308593